MKCSRCGEVCSENQAFCLKCGSPIQVVPDFNLIEAELADSVGKFMDSDDEASKDESVINEEEIDIYGKTRTNIDVKSQSNDEIDSDFVDESDESDDEDDSFSEEDINYIKKVREMKHKAAEQKKKRIIFITIIAAAALVVILLVTLGVRSSLNNYDAHYKKAVEYVSGKDYDKAVNELLAAIDKADTIDEKIEAREALYDVYVAKGNVDNATIASLVKELIDLNPNESKYNEWLLKYVKEIPTSSVKSGSYSDAITIELTADADDIYYTLDGPKPSRNSTKYTAAFTIETEGKTVLKAVSYTDNKASIITEYTYEISFSAVDAPIIEPEGGSYYENTDIYIEVPEGCNVYYTYDGTTPDETSILYEGKVAMLRGNNVFSAIAISQNGTKSKVVSNVYNLNVDANYSYNEAESLLTSP